MNRLLIFTFLLLISFGRPGKNSFGLFSVATQAADRKTELVKTLSGEDLYAYRVLKKLIENDAEKKDKIIFFAKVEITRKDGLLQISTMARASLKAFKSPGGASVISYGLILKNRVEHTDALPKDSVRLEHFVAYKPEFKTGTKVYCFKYEWEIFNKAVNYVPGEIADTDYFINNEAAFQYVGYVDNAYAIVKQNNKFGVVSSSSETLLPAKFSYIIKNDFGLLVEDGHISYFINPVTGKKLSRDYTDVNAGAMFKLKQKLFPVKRNGKMTLLNSRFEEITPLIYDYVSAQGFGANKILTGKREGRWMIIDSETGKETGEYVLH